jgi:Tfp pilus assembly protein PilO
MNKFMLIIQDILENYRRRIDANTHNPERRLELLQNMQNELVKMKETYDMVKRPEDAEFQDMIQSLLN